jgi:hypothetical protein
MSGKRSLTVACCVLRQHAVPPPSLEAAAKPVHSRIFKHPSAMSMGLLFCEGAGGFKISRCRA